MNVVIARQELLSLIGKIQSMVSAKPAIPILANILLEAKDGELTISATDFTVSGLFSTEATVVEEGKIVLPARRLFQLVRELRSPQIIIKSEDSKSAEVLSGSSIFKIHGIHHSEFPKLPHFSSTHTLTINALELKELLQKSVFCASKEDSRYVLNGVLVEITEGSITFTGTDGKRLARTKKKLETSVAVQGSYILPLKAIEEMLRILDDPAAVIKLSFADDKASFEMPSGIVITKLLSGQYPDVEKVIPKSPEYSVQIHREELLALLKQISLFTSETSHSVRFLFECGELTLKAMASSIGQGLVSMPVDCPPGRLEIAFNPFYFIDILRRSSDDCITFSINDSFNPGLLTDSTTSEFVIMPMRLEDHAEDVEQASVSAKPALT